MVKIRRKKKQKKQKKKFRIKRLIAFVLAVALAAGAYKAWSIASPLLSSLNEIKRTDLAKADVSMSVNEGAGDLHKDSDIYNIAIFGLDARAEDEDSRSDTIMILSISRQTKQIKVTSILRDTYVSIPGKGKNKINSAYSFGSAQLALQTINSNFDLAVKEYISVDFSAVAHLTDAMGGVEMDIPKELLADMNKCIQTTNRIFGNQNNSPSVKAGLQILDGRQAVAYCRMRNTGNADFDRTSRQRKLFEALFREFKAKFSADLIIKTADAVKGDIETSMTNKQLFSLCWDIYRCFDGEFITQGAAEKLYPRMVKGQDVLFPDKLTDLSEELHKKIYGDSVYVPTSQLKKISADLHDI